MMGNRLIIGMNAHPGNFEPLTTIGVDYGTTYTGVAFCETSDTKFSENLIQVIQDWPAAHTMIGTKDKVPSEIAYVNNDVFWGSKIQPHVPRHMWTKLELDVPRTGEATYIRSEVEYIQRSPVQVVADFLTRIRQHLLITGISFLGTMNFRHSVEQIVRHVTYRVQLCIVRPAAGFQVCVLRYRAAPKHTDSQLRRL